MFLSNDKNVINCPSSSEDMLRILEFVAPEMAFSASLITLKRLGITLLDAVLYLILKEIVMPRGQRPLRFEEYLRTAFPDMSEEAVASYSSNFRLFTAFIIHFLGEEEVARIVIDARREYNLSETNDDTFPTDIRLLVHWADSGLERYRTERQIN